MRTRNIKLNVFLNEEEHNLLKFKTRKLEISQSTFIRKLIKDYEVNSKTKIDSNIIKSIINDLTKINYYMHRWGYINFESLLTYDIDYLSKLIDDKSNDK